jgi:hypothetical protein
VKGGVYFPPTPSYVTKRTLSGACTADLRRQAHIVEAGPHHRNDRPLDADDGQQGGQVGPAARCLPVASSNQVRGSVSTTFGGVPLVCRGPATHCTAANGGTRTSTLRPGAICSRVRRLSLTAAASTARSGCSSSPASQGSTAATAARISWGSTDFDGTHQG